MIPSKRWQAVPKTEKRWGCLDDISGTSTEAEKKKARLQLQKKARVEARYVMKTLLNLEWSGVVYVCVTVCVCVCVRVVCMRMCICEYVSCESK